jgi:competence protein ComGC
MSIFTNILSVWLLLAVANMTANKQVTTEVVEWER